MSVKKYIILQAILIFLTTGSVWSQVFPATSIPDSLKENSHLVIREFVTELSLQSVNKGSVKIRRVLTILDKEGENQAVLVVPYDKNTSVTINQIVVYDKNGKKIKSVRQSDIIDSPAFSSFELYSDNRVKFYIPDQGEYPYTVAYVYQLNMSNIISYGNWMPVSGYDMSLQYARLTFRRPSEVLTAKKELNISVLRHTVEKNTTIDDWELRNIPAFEDEPFDVSLQERVPCVYLMPERLIYDKYEGNAATWEEYGKWIYSLYNGRDEIAEPEKEKIRLMLKNVPDTLEKIKTLYKYLQDNTRYVAVTIGLGGFQPFDANTVYRTGYGDCKALSNYMHSLLKVIGVRSYPALVAAGPTKITVFRDFPNFQQFNHVILCVPNNSDTIWLECTSQQIPFGFLGDFTDNRDVLLITENGGWFARTTKYNRNANLKTSHSEFNIDPAGTADCLVKTAYQGLQYNNISGFLYLSYDEQKKWLYKNSTLPSLQVTDFSVTQVKRALPFAEIRESMRSKNYCSFSGKYMLLPLNHLNGQKPIQKMLKPRLSDVLINNTFADYDTIVYRIPSSFKVESLPSDIAINSDFGSYSCSVSADKNDLVYVRKFIINEGRYKPGEYSKLYDFYASVARADNAKILLSKE
jgi:hypothetical protein